MSATVEARRVYDELSRLREAVEILDQKVSGLVVAREKPAVSTDHLHVVRTQGVRGGEPVIREKGIAVQTIVALTRHGLTPEQIVEEYDGLLTLAEVHDALGYYYDHSGEIEQYMVENRVALERVWPKRSS